MPLVGRKKQKGAAKIFSSIWSVHTILHFQTGNYEEKYWFYLMYDLTVGNINEIQQNTLKIFFFPWDRQNAV